MPPGTCVLIEINKNGVPCNIPESTLLGTYLGVVARDPMLAPLSFSDWRNKAMEPFKKKMLAEVDSKFEFPGSIRHWILQSLCAKWCNYKINLKAEHMDSRPIEEIMEAVPNRVDPAQWGQLVTQWSQPEDKERAVRNVVNAKRQRCPHTMGRVSSVRRQQETVIQDRLLLWKNNRTKKDGSWSSEDARLRWEQACEILAEEGLTPEAGNSEANERVFTTIMGPEHRGRVRTQGFGVTPTRYFPQSTSTTASTSNAGGSARVQKLEEEKDRSILCDLIFSILTKVYLTLDEFILAGEPQETSTQIFFAWEKVTTRGASFRFNEFITEGLTPEDKNLEANERVFTKIMGPEHPGRVRTQGFGVTPTRYFPQSTSTTGGTSNDSSFARVARLEEDFHSFRSEMRQFMQQIQTHFPPPGSSDMGGNANSSQD